MEIKKFPVVKYVVMTVFIALVFIIGYKDASAHEFTNYNGITMDVSEYMTLVNLGFTEDEIYYMNEETFLANKDLEATLLATDTKYLKTVYPMYGNSYTVELTEEEYNSAVNNIGIEPLGTVETEYKTMVSTISQNGSKYRYHNSVSWNKIPSTRSYDIIGMGFDDDVYISSSVWFNYLYSVSSGSTYTLYNYENKKSTGTGGAVAFQLPTGSIVGLSSNIYYDVSKDTSSTITSLTACGDYSHATSNVSSSYVSNYSISIGGIGLGSGLAGNYDAIPCATAYLSVYW